MSLPLKQLTALNLYLEGRTKGEAMRMAGYSPTTANDHPERLFEHPRFKRELDKRQAKMSEKSEITVEYILTHLKGIVDDEKTAPANKLRALEALMKHLGMMTDKVDIHIKDDLVERIQRGRDRVAGKTEDDTV